MVQNQSFLGKEHENPYLHLQEFKQTCDCLRIEGMSDETLRWKLFPFSLKGRAKQWYNRTIGSKQGDWETLRSSFCLDFFPISKIVSLRAKVLSFKQEDNESLATSWERFNSLIDSGPDLALQDPILLQYFYMGLKKKISKLLNIALGGSFLHISATKARKILDKILADKPEEPSKENPLEEESQITEPKLLSYPPQTSAIPISELPKKEETPILDFILDFKDELFTEYANTSNYYLVRKP
jgi:hypothetical protein